MPPRPHATWSRLGRTDRPEERVPTREDHRLRSRPSAALGAAHRSTTGVPDDRTLVVDALGGDQQAFAQLFRRHGPDVHAFAQRRCRSADLADDVTASAFERAWRSLDQLGERHGGRFRPWVFRIAANEMASTFRSEARRRQRDGLAVTRGVVPHEQTAGASETDGVELRLDNAAVLAAMSELSERQHAVLTLRFLADLTPAETAQALGVSRSNVAVLTHRALGALRVVLDDPTRKDSA
ncbi:MAG: RNA polymerase sigma factor [Ilumatobacter sp.]